MSRETRQFLLVAIPLGVATSVIALALGWGDTAVFVAGMVPLAVVTLVFARREPRPGEEIDHRMKPPAHRGA